MDWQLSGLAVVRTGSCPDWQMSGLTVVQTGRCPLAVVRLAVVQTGSCPIPAYVPFSFTKGICTKNPTDTRVPPCV